MNLKQGHKVKAWLVTWDWGVSDYDKHTDKDSVAAILNPRRSGERVRQFVELLYVTKSYSLSQQMDWARGAIPISHGSTRWMACCATPGFSVGTIIHVFLRGGSMT